MSTTNTAVLNIATPNLVNADLSPVAQFILEATCAESPKALTKGNFEESAKISFEAFRAKTDAVYTTLTALMAAREQSATTDAKVDDAYKAAKDATDAFWYQLGTRKPAKAGGRKRPLIAFSNADLAIFGECCANVRNTVELKAIASKDDATIAISDAFMAFMVKEAGRVLRGQPMERPKIEDAAELRKARNAERAAKAKETKEKNSGKKAASEAKEAELNKKMEDLTNQNKALQSKIKDMEAHAIDTKNVMALVVRSDATTEQKKAILLALGMTEKSVDAVLGIKKEAASKKAETSKPVKAEVAA